MKIFYREAGPRDGPVVLLLHGFPSSSHMFRNLIPLLADRYRVIAPDYPGFGQSGVPDRSRFSYTFSRFADVIDTLTARLGGAFAYRRDLPEAEFHLFDSGHFALEERLREVAPLIRSFLDRKVAKR